MTANEDITDIQIQQRLAAALEECWCLVDATINEHQNVLAKNQRNDELESKFAAELKLNSELREKTEQIGKNSADLDKMCSKFENLNIKGSDQSRLNNARDIVNIGKEYTGIRWDYSAPPNVVKGYVKNSTKKLLECFEYRLDEMEMTAVSANLWKYVASAASVDWQDLVTNRVVDKENMKNN